MSMLPTLSEIGESLATIGELLPTSDMIMGFLEGGLMMAIPIQLVTELIPLFTEMANGQWMIPGGKEKMNMLAYHDEINRGHEGDFYIRRNKIQEYYKNNPQYVWIRDNGVVAQKHNDPYSGVFAGPDLYFDTNLSGTGLWKRTRIIGVEGKAVGLEDDRRDGYWIYLKVCDVDEDCDHRVQKNERGDIGFFFRVGVDGYMLADTEENRNLCTLYNLTLLGIPYTIYRG